MREKSRRGSTKYILKNQRKQDTKKRGGVRPRRPSHNGMNLKLGQPKNDVFE